MWVGLFGEFVLFKVDGQKKVVTFWEIDGGSTAKISESKRVFSVKLEGRRQKNSSCEMLRSLRAK